MPKSRVLPRKPEASPEPVLSVPSTIHILYHGRAYSFKRDRTRDVWRCTVSGAAFRGFHSLMSHFDEVLFATFPDPPGLRSTLGAVYIPWIGLPFGGSHRGFYRDMTRASDAALAVLGDYTLTPERAALTPDDVAAHIGSGADLILARRRREDAEPAPQDPQEAAEASTLTPPGVTESDGDSRAETAQ
jgi:hypothetical protein